MKNVLILAGALAIGATMASAGGMAVAVDPVVAAPVVVSDWTGPYAGVSFGHVKASALGVSATDNGYGIFAGYRYDFGQLVVGGELEYARGTKTKTDSTEAKVMLGYDAGRVLPYALVGYGKSSGVSAVAYGLGADFKVQENWTVGVEYMHSEPKIGGIKVKGDSIAIRAAYRF